MTEATSPVEASGRLPIPDTAWSGAFALGGLGALGVATLSELDFGRLPNLTDPGVRWAAILSLGVGLTVAVTIYVRNRRRTKRALLAELASSSITALNEMPVCEPAEFVASLAQVHHRRDYEFGGWANRAVRTTSSPSEFVVGLAYILNRSKLILGLLRARPVFASEKNRIFVVFYSRTSKGILAFSGTLVRIKANPDGLDIAWRRTGVKPRYLRAGLSMSAHTAEHVHAEVHGAIMALSS